MTQRVLGPSGSKRRRRRLLGLMALAGATVTVFFVAASSGAPLSGSTFDTGNGTLTDTTDHDWNPAGDPSGNVGPVETITCGNTVPSTGTNCGLDLVNNAADESFGQGSKNDTPAPTVVDGSIPPNKDDLSRFYVNQERAANDYLYLAWERSNLLGSAHMDFEFNQKFCTKGQTPADPDCSANGVTPTRTEGDFLIDFDFGGSGVPALNIHRWITSGTCEASGQSPPCWSVGVPLGANANASVNSAAVIDENPPNDPRTLAGDRKTSGPGGINETISSTFGEAGMNLTGLNIFPQNQCAHFGSVYLKSRSSGQSFTSELKDFIAPIPVDISNCGQVIIRKVTEPAGDTTTEFGYTTDVVTAPATTTSPFSLKDGEDNTIENVLAGDYNVTEDDPSGDDYKLTDIDCEASSVPDADIDIDVDARTVDFEVEPNETLDCTFTNTLQIGALKILKQSTKTGNPLVSNAGAVFSYDSSSVTDNGTGDEVSDVGEVCVSGVLQGDYTVNETSPPDGYGDASEVDQSVTVEAGTDCTDNLPGSGATATFTNPPLADLLIRVEDGGSGEISSTIDCDPPFDVVGPTDAGDTAELDEDDIEATQIINCTITIDP